jgi:tellurite resistance protein
MCRLGKVSDDTKKNSETLARITDGVQNIISAITSSSEALDTIQKENISKNDRREAAEVIEKSKNSMMMFLKKMQEDE